MSAKLFYQCLAEIQSRKSWSGIDSADPADWSPAVIDALAQIAAAAAPVIKARQAARELKRIERAAPALEKLMQDEREVKNQLLAELREPNAARLAAIKAGPPNWDIQ